MSDRKYYATLLVDVEFVVPEDAITRVLENHDENGDPQPLSKGGSGWRDKLYDLSDEESVVQMLAYNLAVRSRSLDTLDGWADIDDPYKARNPYSRRYLGEIKTVEVESFGWDAA